jgi:hypothetical protein
LELDVDDGWAGVDVDEMDGFARGLAQAAAARRVRQRRGAASLPQCCLDALMPFSVPCCLAFRIRHVDYNNKKAPSRYIVCFHFAIA